MKTFFDRSSACAFLSVITAFAVHGQSAPGGVGDLSGTSVLRLWVSSGSTNVTANDSPVDTLFDLSGAGNHLYAPSATARPVLQTDQINGYPTIQFDGVQQQLIDPVTDTSFRNNEATLIVVATREASGSVISISDANSNDEFLILNQKVYHHSSPGNWKSLGHQCPVTDTVSDYTITTAVFGIAPDDIQNDYFQIPSSMSIVNTGNPIPFNVVDKKIHIGQRDVLIPAEWLDGGFVEAIGYNRKLTPVELDAAISYLENKYQISEHCLSTGVSEISEPAGINLYPNPTSGHFTISIDDIPIKTKVEIFNSIGELIYHEDILGLSSKEVDLGDIPQGVYYVRVSNGERSYSKKLVVGLD